MSDLQNPFVPALRRNIRRYRQLLRENQTAGDRQYIETQIDEFRAALDRHAAKDQHAASEPSGA
jgi:hypothetical protein